MGAVLGAIVAVMICRSRGEAAVARAVAEAESKARTTEMQLREDNARYLADRTSFNQRLEDMNRAQAQLKDVFNALCAEALRSNNEQFLQLARTELERVRAAASHDLQQKEAAIEGLVAPIRDSLASVDVKLQEIERDRVESFSALGERLSQANALSEQLRGETATLARALSSANVRGVWGELQLRRVVELAGMVEHCDFETQHSVNGDDGALRPDMVVHLPGERTIVVDAKTPATALLELVNRADGAERLEACKALAAQVRRHMGELSHKSYWERFGLSPEFVVLFLPSEAFFSIALQGEPELFEQCFAQNVLVATPTTLVALLKAVAFGWRQEAIARNAREISDLGRELYDRIATLGGHVEKLGSNLRKAVNSYNSAVGSLETRVLPSARRFVDLGAARTRVIPDLRAIELQPHALVAPELVAVAESEQSP